MCCSHTHTHHTNWNCMRSLWLFVFIPRSCFISTLDMSFRLRDNCWNRCRALWCWPIVWRHVRATTLAVRLIMKPDCVYYFRRMQINYQVCKYSICGPHSQKSITHSFYCGTHTAFVWKHVGCLCVLHFVFWFCIRFSSEMTAISTVLES